MKRTIRIVAPAFVIALAAGCSDGLTTLRLPEVDENWEVSALESVGIAEDQANGSSVVPASASAEISIRLATEHGPCTFSASTGRSTCPDVTREGVTISRSFALYDAAGNVQEKRDTTTVTINTQVWARGTTTRDGGSVTIDRKSDLTATGVQRGSPSRRLNGTESGSSSMERQTSRGKVKSTVVFGDTTINLVIPQNDPARRWPLSGTVIRAHSGTRTMEGSSDSHSFGYRAVFVYDGTSTVRITITANGRTVMCVRNMATREQHCGS